MAAYCNIAREPLSSAGSLFSSWSVLDRLLAELKRRVENAGPDRRTCFGRSRNGAEAWEDQLAEAALAATLRALGADWGFVRLAEPATGLQHLRSIHGLRSDAWKRIAEKPSPVERDALDSRRLQWATDPSGDAPLDPPPAPGGSRSMVAIPLSAYGGRPEGMIVLGYGSNGPAPAVAAIEGFAEAAKSLASALHTHREIQQLLLDPEPPGVRNEAAGRAIQGAAKAPSTLSVAFGRANRSETRCGYSMAARAPSGDTRLFASGLGITDLTPAWEALALDALFRTAGALCGTPADLAAMMYDDSIAALADDPHGTRFCCADVAESGKEYVFAGNVAHLHYENASHLVTELSGQPPREGEPDGWKDRHGRIHSGDVLILHSGLLPRRLPERHDVQRRLTGLLAREGRRPVEALAPHVAAILHESSDCDRSEPALVILRSE